MNFDLKDKVALVTGAGSGIGREICVTLAKANASVVAVGRDRERVEETASLVRDLGSRSLALFADVTSRDQISGAVDAAITSFGMVDIAINNAGVGQDAGLTGAISIDQWTRAIDTNLTGVWNCMAAELRHMAQRKRGAIVNIASIAGLHTLPMMSAYTASKHGVVALTRNAALEYVASGIRINAICPGGIYTAMMANHLASLPGDPVKIRAAANARHPVNRMGKESEVSAAVLFLCAEESDFTTGQAWAIDGGRSIA
jgi:NAD(P)-dependent dehydrogenase (short-subunit alcohol dehydrogenase family)